MLEADDPKRYARMKANGTLMPTARSLGERAHDQWQNLIAQLRRKEPGPPGAIAQAQHLMALDSTATEIVLADMYTPRPDPERGDEVS
jgi:hypothetical protein